MVRGEKVAPEPKMSEGKILMRQPIPIIADKTRENGPNEVTSNEISSVLFGKLSLFNFC